MLNLILFGPPGSGKGTQSVKLAKKYNLIHLSTGDMLRSQIAKKTELGLAAKEIMDRGELVSDKIVIGMIEKQIEENPEADGFIFDGFPRTTVQAIALDDLLEKHGTSIAATLSLEVNKAELVKRLLERGKDSGRADDQNEKVIENRVNEYNIKTSPLIEYYKEEKKYCPVKGVGDINDVFGLLCHEIEHNNAGEVHGEGVLESVHTYSENHKSKNNKQKHHKKQNLMSNENNHNQGHSHDEHHDEKHTHTEEHKNEHGHHDEHKNEHGHAHHDDHKKEHGHDDHKKEHGHDDHKKEHGHHDTHHTEHKKAAVVKHAPKKAAVKPAAKPAAKKAAPKKAAKKHAPKKAAKKHAPKKAAKKHAPKKAAKKHHAKKHAAKKHHAKKHTAKKHTAKKHTAKKHHAKKHAAKKHHAKGKKKH